MTASAVFMTLMRMAAL